MKNPNLEVIEFPSMIKSRFGPGLVAVNSDIMAIGGDLSAKEELKKYIETIEIYSDKGKSWQKHNIQIEEKMCYCCCCVFKNKLFLIGGLIESSKKTKKTCCTYSFKTNKWTQTVELNVERCVAACTVYDGKIVVSGGAANDNDDELKSVEAYDYYEDKWIYFP